MDQPIAEITRQFSLGVAYDIPLQQRLRNLSDQTLEVVWHQYGPVDLPVDESGYIERRRLHVGYLPDPQRYPTDVVADRLVLERSEAVKRATRAAGQADPPKAHELRTLWPNDDATSRGWALSWFATTNRYFGLAVHPPTRDQAPLTHAMESVAQEIELGVGTNPNAKPDAKDKSLLYTLLHSPAVRLAPGGEHAFDIGIYAGPLDRQVLNQPPYDSL